MKSENVLSWNVPNVVSIFLMVALLWTILGFGSHFVRKMAPTQVRGTKADSNGGIVAV